MSKHTPEPWKVATGSANNGYVFSESAGCVICERPFREDVRGYAAWPANARLIAAAPDLLAALKAMSEADDAHWPIATAREVRDAARAAIAKAEGGAA